ncbi:Ppx/GppA phosphatase family protein [Acetohalobium arabaticum]|uniref:Ppx/GppA phosphatase n=1 Tax=Acetohalobium arabaticum (strain ATCC 49924 / DSM 5501 / Z-7288) TaxID=574087 RepID=D9QSX0_ACEAZ|nr:Ppx/GppA phosphatase family protein [Acetohalobium arabaticum]ADL11658.1 Ppx/GppA phosphatase [Acetohalobium arabaticum DSM 5501]
MPKVAAIDIGTNSTRLLIAKIEKDQSINPLATELKTTRLGAGVDKSGYLQNEAIIRTVEALKEYAELIADYQVEAVRAVATSAVRDVSNQQEFINEVKTDTGIEVEIIDGSREADLSYLGATKGLDCQLTDDNLVLDIGGGSTEFIFGSETEIKEKVSVDVGAVRMTEKETKLKSRQELIGELLNPVLNKLQGRVKMLLGVGGTITTLAAVDQQLSPYNPEEVHGYQLELERIKRILSDLSAKTIDERKEVVGLQPERADIIVAGVRILLEVMDNLNISEITVSEADILDGLIYDYCK